jgi:hypothetical protein
MKKIKAVVYILPTETYQEVSAWAMLLVSDQSSRQDFVEVVLY